MHAHPSLSTMKFTPDIDWRDQYMAKRMWLTICQWCEIPSGSRTQNSMARYLAGSSTVPLPVSGWQALTEWGGLGGGGCDSASYWLEIWITLRHGTGLQEREHAWALASRLQPGSGPDQAHGCALAGAKVKQRGGRSGKAPLHDTGTSLGQTPPGSGADCVWLSHSQLCVMQGRFQWHVGNG